MKEPERPSDHPEKSGQEAEPKLSRKGQEVYEALDHQRLESRGGLLKVLQDEAPGKSEPEADKGEETQIWHGWEAGEELTKAKAEKWAPSQPQRVIRFPHCRILIERVPVGQGFKAFVAGDNGEKLTDNPAGYDRIYVEDDDYLVGYRGTDAYRIDQKTGEENFVSPDENL